MSALPRSLAEVVFFSWRRRFFPRPQPHKLSNRLDPLKIQKIAISYYLQLLSTRRGSFHTSMNLSLLTFHSLTVSERSISSVGSQIQTHSFEHPGVHSSGLIKKKEPRDFFSRAEVSKLEACNLKIVLGGLAVLQRARHFSRETILFEGHLDRLS